MKTRLPALAVAFVLTAGLCSVLSAHCQIPCGIYDDPARFAAMREHVTTIRKSMKQIQSLSQAEQPNYNQLVRWVNNKEAHADKLVEIVTAYFMAQRVKPTGVDDKAAYAKYVEQITVLHEILVTTMKAKQTTDLAYCTTLDDRIGRFEQAYLGKYHH